VIGVDRADDLQRGFGGEGGTEAPGVVEEFIETILFSAGAGRSGLASEWRPRCKFSASGISIARARRKFN